MTRNQILARAFSLLLVVFVALWLRWPRINEGLPFFYGEDEAHHFNRLANMVKSGDLNPHYFLKPSLHFYLRFPAFAAGFLEGVRKGELKSLKEVKTNDPFGVGDYAFSASHPIIVRSVRAFSVVLSLGVVVLAFALAAALSGSSAVAFTAGMLTAISPSLVGESAVIGVDGVMSFFCLAAVVCAIQLQKHFSLGRLALTGVLCGFAVSSKYNALPIAILPFAACLLEGQLTVGALAIALATPALAFLAGSPYLLGSIPLFLDQVAFEVWHYGVAVHEGHTAEPGLPQAIFYMRWLNQEALGPIATAFGTVGVILLWVKNQKSHLLLVLFPALFAALMIAQKTNFTRNMVVVIPFIVIIASLAVFYIGDLLSLNNRTRVGIFSAFFLAASFLPPGIGLIALRERKQVLSLHDSRLDAITWIENRAQPADIAASGQLQLPQNAYALPGVSRIDEAGLNPGTLALHGYSYLLTSVEYTPPSELNKDMPVVKEFAGTPRLERVVNNPAMKLFELAIPTERFFEALRANLEILQINLAAGDTSAPACTVESRGPQIGEDYCWISNRALLLKFSNLPSLDGRQEQEQIPIKLQIMSPWPAQRMEVKLMDWSFSHTFSKPGEWETVELAPPVLLLKSGELMSVLITQIHSPQEMGLSSDPRRLGVAVKRGS